MEPLPEATAPLAGQPPARYERHRPEATLEIVGRGESEPVGDNATAEGRAQNQRVVAKRTDWDK